MTFAFLPSRVLPPEHDVTEKTLQLPRAERSNRQNAAAIVQTTKETLRRKMLRKTTQNRKTTFYPKVLHILATWQVPAAKCFKNYAAQILDSDSTMLDMCSSFQNAENTMHTADFIFKTLQIQYCASYRV